MNICIVGGGTAGWISAFVLSKKFINYKITLIESKNIPIIGVGPTISIFLIVLMING
jgi:tryptophan halogenase